MLDNRRRLELAVAIAIADAKFMGNTTKVDNAIEALTPKSTVTATFKRLQGLALSDFLVNKDKKTVGYTDEARDEKIKSYVLAKFQKHMDDPKTSAEAKQLFNAVYPAAPPADSVPADGIADIEEQAA